MYICETWTLEKEERKKNWSLMLQTCAKDNMDGQNIKREGSTKNERKEKRRKTVVKRRCKLVGHILRRGRIMLAILEGRSEEENVRGRPNQLRETLAEPAMWTWRDWLRTEPDSGWLVTTANQSTDWWPDDDDDKRIYICRFNTVPSVSWWRINVDVWGQQICDSHVKMTGTLRYRHLTSIKTVLYIRKFCVSLYCAAGRHMDLFQGRLKTEKSNCGSWFWRYSYVTVPFPKAISYVGSKNPLHCSWRKTLKLVDGTAV